MAALFTLLAECYERRSVLIINNLLKPGQMYNVEEYLRKAKLHMQVWDRVVPARSFETLWVLASGVLIALVIEFTIRMVRVELADYFGKDV